jgi:hypothetical protein
MTNQLAAILGDGGTGKIDYRYDKNRDRVLVNIGNRRGLS